MDGLVEWLEACIVADEELTEVALHGDDWHPAGECDSCDATRAARALGAGSDRWRVECEAKRRIVEKFAAVDSGADSDYELGFGLLFAVRSHAAAYADRPGFRQEWRP